MGYLRFSCGVAALAGAAVVAIYATSGAVPPKGGGTGAITPAGRQAGQLQPRILVPLRKSITQLTPAELASLRKGFAQMIAWDGAAPGSANYKRSLVYWANMHAYIGNPCSDPSGLSNPGMSGLSLQSASTPDEVATWCKCEHGTDQFLTWHRMYLYYFEKVLQAASGDPKLRLPYWDYETNGHLPKAYRDKTYVLNGQTVPNPLYVANRQAQLNAGTAALTPAVVSTAGAMPKTSYSPFNDALQDTPHGSVHCATGVNDCPTGYMGYVPSAGNDPIFYSHHANIDRLYECWLQVNPSHRLPTGSILTASFSFIDGTGALVTKTVGSMLTTQQLHYGYTAGGGCPLRRIPFPILRGVQPRIVPLVGPTQLARGVTTVPIKLAPVGAHAAAAAPKQATLVLEGLSFDRAPGVMYEVALQAPNGRRVTVGVINFFTETAPHHGEMKGMAAPNRKTFEATAALQALGGAQNAQLVLQPTTGVTAHTTAMAAAHINPVANIRFTDAHLELR